MFRIGWFRRILSGTSADFADLTNRHLPKLSVHDLHNSKKGTVTGGSGYPDLLDRPIRRDARLEDQDRIPSSYYGRIKPTDPVSCSGVGEIGSAPDVMITNFATLGSARRGHTDPYLRHHDGS